MDKTLKELSDFTGTRVVGDGSVVLGDAASIEEASERDITFVASLRAIKEGASSRAGALIVGEDLEEREELKGRNLLVSTDPVLAFAAVLDLFRPELRPDAGVDPLAKVAAGATISDGASVGAFVVIEDGATLSDGAVIYPGVYIGHGVTIGSGTVVYPNVIIREGTTIGQRVVIHSGTAIGSDGFGFVPTREGLKKMPQRGRVVIHDDVEIGSLVTIDRATTGETVIGRGTKIDNLVQVAHNVKVGEDSIVVAQVGISGSTQIGKRVQIGGQAGLVGHLKVGDDAKIGAKSGVSGDIAPGEIFSGSPAIPHSTWLRSQTIVKKLPELKRVIDGMEKRLEVLENKVCKCDDQASKEEETGDD